MRPRPWPGHGGLNVPNGLNHNGCMTTASYLYQCLWAVQGLQGVHPGMASGRPLGGSSVGATDGTFGGSSGVASRWAPRLTAVLVWLAAGASMAYGVMHGLGQGPSVALPVTAAPDQALDVQAVARALGARLAPLVQASGPALAEPGGRYSLLGVVSPATASDSGVALIVVDGQRPLPYRVGAVVDGRWVVQSVGKRTVVLVPQPGVPAAASGTAEAGLTLALPERQ